MSARLRAPSFEGLHGYGWLPAVLPASARRFRVADPVLARGLERAGAELVDSGADVEIGPDAMLRGEAPLSLATVVVPPATGPLPLRAGARVANSARVSLGAIRARRASRRRYPVAEVLRFDLGHAFAVPGSAAPPPPRRLVERLPQQAVVIGRRGEQGPTVLEAALDAASEAAGRGLRPRWASIRAGLVVVFAEDSVLRVAVGHGREQIAAQLANLDAIAAAGPSPAVAERLPWPVARGEMGVAAWSLERLMEGARPAKELSPALLDESVDFLVELWRVPDGVGGAASLSELAATTATVCDPAGAALVQAVGERVEKELEGLPRGFAHGDFFAGNLLASGDRLTAVLDWDAGGPGRLPFVDLLHLHRTLVHGGDDLWGPSFLAEVSPFARSGGDDTVVRYGKAVGIEPDRRLLESLAVAYWLEHTAYQLRTHHHRRSQRKWIEANVDRVVAELGPFARG